MSNHGPIRDSDSFCCGLLTIDRAGLTAWFGSTRVVLTPAEIQVLFALASGEENIVDRATLARHLTVPFQHGRRGVDMHVHRLRLKLAYACGDSLHIETVYRLGYRLHVAESAFDIAPRRLNAWGASRRQSIHGAVEHAKAGPDPQFRATTGRAVFSESGTS